MAVAAPDAEVGTRFAGGGVVTAAGGVELGTLEGWFFAATAFDSGRGCDAEALARAVWAQVQGSAAFNERYGLGADLLFGFCAADGGGTPTLKALLVPRKLVLHAPAAEGKPAVSKPRKAGLGLAGPRYDLDGKVLSGLLVGVTSEEFESLCGTDRQAVLRTIGTAFSVATVGEDAAADVASS